MIYLILWTGFCVWFARIDDKKIEYRDKWGKWKRKIKHFWNGLRHIVAAVGVFLLTDEWKLSMALLFTSRLVFSISLCLFRDKTFMEALRYVSPKPKSIVDQVEKWVCSILANSAFKHHEINDAMGRASITIKVFLFVKIVFLVLM